MQSLRYFIFFLLCGLHVLSSKVPIQCHNKQYAWPLDNPSLCCNKCKPGEKMQRPRVKNICDIECIPCEGERFSDNYNVELSCKVCEICDKPNMGYKSKCNSTHNTVCKCNTGYRCKDQACTQCELVAPTKKPTSPRSTKANMSNKCNSTHNTVCKCNAGYRCKDQACTQCELVAPTTKPTSPPSIKAADPTTPEQTKKQVRDTVFFLVIISLLCMGIALLAFAKMKPFLRWIRSHTVYIVTDNPAEKPLRTEDEDMPKPVQEACGKCDQCIDICVKD